ncbi:MAG: phospholipase A, partial [Proteobacteria bacterium]|nr:phospholipase A [Pseudomonadota bacterium]
MRDIQKSQKNASLFQFCFGLFWPDFHATKRGGYAMKWTCALLMLSCMWPQMAVGADYEKCVGIVSDAERLACYDQAAALGVKPLPAVPEPCPVVAEQRPDGVVVADSFLGKSWELDAHTKTGTFHFREYKPVYILPVHYSNNPNQSPSSPAPNSSEVLSESTGRTEVKYQLSFKTKLWENILEDSGDLWFAYTQQSHW